MSHEEEIPRQGSQKMNNRKMNSRTSDELIPDQPKIFSLPQAKQDSNNSVIYSDILSIYLFIYLDWIFFSNVIVSVRSFNRRLFNEFFKCPEQQI